jgi:hypothetical protein
VTDKDGTIPQQQRPDSSFASLRQQNNSFATPLVHHEYSNTKYDNHSTAFLAPRENASRENATRRKEEPLRRRHQKIFGCRPGFAAISTLRTDPKCTWTIQGNAQHAKERHHQTCENGFIVNCDDDEKDRVAVTIPTTTAFNTDFAARDPIMTKTMYSRRSIPLVLSHTDFCSYKRKTTMTTTTTATTTTASETAAVSWCRCRRPLISLAR